MRLLKTTFSVPVAFVVLAALAACGKSGDTPPTGDEIAGAYKTFWNEAIPENSRITGNHLFEYLTPTAAEVTGQGITSTSPDGDLYQTIVTLRFTANTGFIYRCLASGSVPVTVAPLGTTVSDPVNVKIAQRGDTVACAARASFRKVKEGWVLLELGGHTFDDVYLIKR